MEGGTPNIQVVLVSPKDVFDPIFFHGNDEARRWLNEKAASLWSKEVEPLSDPDYNIVSSVFLPIVTITSSSEEHTKQSFHHGITPSGHSLVIHEFDKFQFLAIDGTLPPQWLERKLLILYDLIRMLYGSVSCFNDKRSGERKRCAVPLASLLERATEQLRTQQCFLVDAHQNMAKHFLKTQTQSMVDKLLNSASGAGVQYAFVISGETVVAQYTRKGVAELTNHDVHLLTLYARLQIPGVASDHEKRPVSRSATTPRTSFLTPDHVEANLSEDRSFLDASAVLSHQHIPGLNASRNASSLHTGDNTGAHSTALDDSRSGPTTTTTYDTCESTLAEAHTARSEGTSDTGSKPTSNTMYEADHSAGGTSKSAADSSSNGGVDTQQHVSRSVEQVVEVASSSVTSSSKGSSNSGRRKERSSVPTEEKLEGRTVFLETVDGTKDHFFMYVRPVTSDAHVILIREGTYSGQMARMFQLWEHVHKLAAMAQEIAPFFPDLKEEITLAVRGAVETADCALSINGDYTGVVPHNGRDAYCHANLCTHLFYDAVYGGWVVAPQVEDASEDWLARCQDEAVQPDLAKAPWTVRGYDGEELLCESMTLCAYNMQCQVRMSRDGWAAFTPCGEVASYLRQELVDLLVQVYTEQQADVMAREERMKDFLPQIKTTNTALAAIARLMERDNPTAVARFNRPVRPPMRTADKQWDSRSVHEAANEADALLRGLHSALFSKYVQHCLRADSTTDGRVVTKLRKRLAMHFQPDMLESLRASARADPYLGVRFKYPGLVHFLFVNRSEDVLYCSPLPDGARYADHDSPADANAFLLSSNTNTVVDFIPDFKDQLWTFYLEARNRLVHGFTTYSSKQSALRFVYTLWFESNEDRLLPPATEETLAAFRDLGRDNSSGSTAFQALTKQLFPEWRNEVVCYELCYVSLSFLPFDFVCEQATMLARELKYLHK